MKNLNFTCWRNQHVPETEHSPSSFSRTDVDIRFIRQKAKLCFCGRAVPIVYTIRNTRRRTNGKNEQNNTWPSSSDHGLQNIVIFYRRVHLGPRGRGTLESPGKVHAFRRISVYFFPLERFRFHAVITRVSLSCRARARFARDHPRARRTGRGMR